MILHLPAGTRILIIIIIINLSTYVVGHPIFYPMGAGAPSSRIKQPGRGTYLVPRLGMLKYSF
jgi:hypothetical protein